MASNDAAYGDGGRKPASVFLSHAHLDKAVARQVYREFSRHSVDCWFDEAELKPGDSLIQRLQTAIDNTDYLVVLLSPASVSSAWVQRELNSVLVEEIKGRHVKVVPVMIADCEVPRFLMDKIYIDLRDDFLRKMSQLISFLKGEKATVPTPRQMVIADLVERAPRGLWQTIGMPSIGQQDMADSVRTMTDKEIDAAIVIGRGWFTSRYKTWESSLTGSLTNELKVSPVEAKRLLRRLEDLGLIALARDLNYTRGQVAYTQEAPLWVLKRAAQQTGLFESLGAPEPYSLSQFLIYRQPVMLVSSRFYATKFDTVTLIENNPVFAVIKRQEEPRQSWIFSSADDDRPRHIFDRWRGPNPSGAHHVMLHMDLEEFDDLGLLRPGTSASSS